jgi:hypothetical protein
LNYLFFLLNLFLLYVTASNGKYLSKKGEDLKGLVLNAGSNWWGQGLRKQGWQMTADAY